MAKKQYESKIATQTKNFINVKTPSLVEETEKNTSEKEQIVEEKPEDKSTEDLKPIETVTPEKKYDNDDPNKFKYDLDAMVQAKLQELLSSGKLIGSLNSKAGRPRKYEEKTRIASIRLEESVYEYARQMGRTEFESMTEYINQLIKNDMLSKR